MDIISTIQTYLLPFLAILTVLVFVHEFGHYWVAKRCGVKIEVFSVGFGPELFGWTDRTGTRWKFSAIPLGGYVKMFGDADVASRPGKEAFAQESGEELHEGEETGDWAEGHARRLSAEERAVSFHHKRLPQRAAIVAAGPIANFIAAIFILIGLFTIFGQLTTPPIIGKIVEGSAAEESGLQVGDRILFVEGHQIDRFEDIQLLVQVNLDNELALEVERAGEVLTIMARPKIIVIEDRFGNDHETARLGISAGGTELRRMGLVESFFESFEETWRLAKFSLQTVSQMIVGERSAKQLAGPLGIAEMSGEVAKYGAPAILNYMALLSISLGLINLFPIPMLDGGHLLFYAIEAARGKPLGEKAQEFGFRIGLALVLSLVVFVTWNDLSRLGVFEFISGFIRIL